MKRPPMVDRFVVLRREPGVLYVLDQYLAMVEVVVFPADPGTCAHVRWQVTTQAVEQTATDLLAYVAREATARLVRAGYTAYKSPAPCAPH